jgi:glycosyltransferase involved in cell wall biosynthesis
VVPTALVDCTVSETAPRKPDSTTIILTGVMSFGPNVDAALFFVKEIFPLVLREKPAARVVLAGASPSPEILALATTGAIDVTGPADDLGHLIAGAAIYALPMRLGSGIRTKLLDVFPRGVPIVTTTVGAEGFDLRHEETALFADTAPAFAQACIRLLDDRTLGVRLGDGARRLSAGVNTQENVRCRMAEVLERCLPAAVGLNAMQNAP